jgi:thiamine pyrophosphokinase
MRALIIANGSDLQLEDLDELLNNHDLIFVTDGAAQRLPPTNRALIICGDFDSIDLDDARTRHPKAEFLRLPDQSTNDLEKAIMLARDRGAEMVTLLGVFGGRLDQSFATVSVMLRYHGVLDIVSRRGGAAAWIISPTSIGEGSLRIEAAPGDGVATLPISPDATVTLTNVRWPLAAERLKAGSRGVSNEALGGVVEVNVTTGIVLFCHDKSPHCHDSSEA